MIIFYYSEWSPPGQARVISVTGCNHSQVVCAAGPILFHLEVRDGKLVQNGDTTLEYEIACIGEIIIPKIFLELIQSYPDCNFFSPYRYHTTNRK